MKMLLASRWTPIALFLCAVVLFLMANRGAYKGYFSDDDLDNLGWSPSVGMDVYYNDLATPAFQQNVRPIGFLYYRFLYKAFKLHFFPYVATLQALHILNVVLLLLILVHLGFSGIAAGAGALFYAFHAAVIEAYWKPMFVFDTLCATFSLLTLLLYIRGHWIIALVSFWLTYKSKELAVMLPIALLAYEWLLGQRKWKRLIPYFAISLSFGLQALWNNRHVPPDNNYALRFTPDLLWNSLTFYSSTILFVPFLGLALLLSPIVIRDRRLYLGLIFMCSTLVVLLVLIGRLQTVYWYVPMIGLAIMVAAIAARTPAWTVVVFFLFWLPLNYVLLRDKRREILALADEDRWYTTGLLEYARHVPPLKAVIYQGTPGDMKQWGIAGAIHQAFGLKTDAVWYLDTPNVEKALAQVPMAIVSYSPVNNTVKGLLRTRNEAAPYVRFADSVPIYQFGSGWTTEGGVPRWIPSEGNVTLHRTPSANEFELVARGQPDRPTHVTVLENGRALGTGTLNGTQFQPLRWKLPDGALEDNKITIRADSEIAVDGIGYVRPDA